jgi:hypothetical protein
LLREEGTTSPTHGREGQRLWKMRILTSVPLEIEPMGPKGVYQDEPGFIRPEGWRDLRRTSGGKSVAKTKTDPAARAAGSVERDRRGDQLLPLV